MTKQDKLKEMLKKRNPLLETKREAVMPVNLYTKPQVDKGEEVLEQAVTAVNRALKGNLTIKSIQVDKTTSGQVDKRIKPQVVKPTKPRVVKYTTHLKPETIKELKHYALENDQKDYEVMQEAIETYLKGKKKP
jgi:hypothetical protein